MKDNVRLIFSLIRQQTEMEGGEQEVGGMGFVLWRQRELNKRGHGDLETRHPVLWGERCHRRGWEKE
jgi:hypothetical protein